MLQVICQICNMFHVTCLQLMLYHNISYFIMASTVEIFGVNMAFVVAFRFILIGYGSFTLRLSGQESIVFSCSIVSGQTSICFFRNIVHHIFFFFFSFILNSSEVICSIFFDMGTFNASNLSRKRTFSLVPSTIFLKYSLLFSMNFSQATFGD